MPDLNNLNKQIVANELLLKFSACGLTWDELQPMQFRAYLVDNLDEWTLYLCRDAQNNRIMLDFSKNGTYFYTLNSNDVEEIADLFYNVEQDMASVKDLELYKHLMDQTDCP